MALVSMSGAIEATPAAEGSTTTRKKNPKWTTNENLVLLKGWIKFRTNTVVGRNQKSIAFWCKIADYCNEHCSFDPPRDRVACRNHYNYINKLLSKWRAAYDNAKRMKQSEWSENDVLTKAHEIYVSGNNVNFTLTSEWHALRDQPRYVSHAGENTQSNISGSKRARESDVADSNSIGSTPRPMGKETTKKKKGNKKDKEVRLEVVNEARLEYKQFKEKELERLDKIATQQEVTNKLMKDKIQAKKMKMWMKLSEREHLDNRSKQLFEMLGAELFGK